MQFSLATIFVASMPILSACTSYNPDQVTGPRVTIQDAFTSLAEGLQNFKNTMHPNTGNPNDDYYAGVVVCKVAVQFNVSANAARGGGVSATLEAPIEAVKAGLAANQTNTSSGTAGNLVYVELDNVDTDRCAREGSPFAQKAAGDTTSTADNKTKTASSTDNKTKTASSTDNKPAASKTKTPIQPVAGTPGPPKSPIGWENGQFCLYKEGSIYMLPPGTDASKLPTCKAAQ